MSEAYLLPQLLAAAAEQRPEAVALRCESRTMTYGELEAESNRLAHALVELGVRPRDCVGIHLGKTIESIVAAFGIMKANAAYVPIEPHSPPSRLAGIVRQCGIGCLIASARTAGKTLDAAFDGGPLQTVLVTDAPAHSPTGQQPAGPTRLGLNEILRHQPAEPPARTAIDRDLAYVLFTSGSTGEPKGVMLSHRSALTFVNWACDTFGLGPNDRLSNHAPLNFDLSVFDIFAGVKAGAAITLIPERLSPFPLSVAELIERDCLTVWYSVPSALTMMLTRGRLAERDLSALRLVLFAGEVFPVKHLRAVMAAIPGAGFFNLYGPTETNVCTYYRVPSLAPEQTAPIPIGRACANTQVIALAASGTPVNGPGEEGLLYVRGSTVMDGYFGRPEDTERAFLRRPGAPGGEDLLYCTGDWVTLDGEGNYHLLGRRDDMVKTRGYRVELGEVESALYAHPGVLEAAALAVPHEELGAVIRAFVVPAGADEISEVALKRHCAGRIPPYMLPEQITITASLPRTATGKIDRPRLRRERVGGTE